MPRLSSTGDALMGYAGAILSVNGATPAAFAGRVSGNGAWFNPGVTFSQVETAAGSNLFKVQGYTIATTAFTTYANTGADVTVAGGGTWAWWTPGGGTFTSLPGAAAAFPLGLALNASFTGDLAILASYHAAGGILIYEASGALIANLAVVVNANGISGTCPPFLRDNLITYSQAGAGFRVASYRPVIQTLSMFVASDGPSWMTPVVDGTDVWLLERRNINGILTIRKKDDTTAWVITPAAVGDTYNPDVMLLSPGVARIAWSSGPGENPTELLVMDLTLATGANDLGTVVGSSLVFTPQAPLGTVVLAGSAIPAGPASGGGGGGGGGSVPGSGSPGTGPVDSDNTPPPTDLPPVDPRRYPHIPEIKDWPTQQSLKLAWDTLGSQATAQTSLKAVVDAQTATIEILKTEIAELKSRG